MSKQKDYAAIWAAITRSQEKLMREYSEITICIPETHRWDYAIPENYTNYQDGFLFPDFEAYKGMPLFYYPSLGTLYLRWAVPYYVLKDGESEKHLCYNRQGEKVTVIIESAPKHPDGNPSYFRFLPKVKKYKPSANAKRRQYEKTL